MSSKGKVVVDWSTNIQNVGILHYVAMILWVGWFVNLPVLIIILGILYQFNIIAFTILLGLLLLTIFYPIDFEMQPKWAFDFGDWCMKKATDYFGMKIIMVNPKELEKCAPAIIVLEPHDVLPVSICYYSDALGFFKGHSVRGCVSSVCFMMPFMKHIYTWAGATSVDKKNLQKLIEKGKSPVVCPGGAQEVIYLKNNQEIILYLKNRFGLVKIAMQYGIPLVPSLAFGQRPSYDYWVPKSKLIHSIGRKIGFIPMLFFGAFGIPMFIPKSKQITLVVGAPVSVPKIDNPTTEQMLEYQSKLIAAYEEIFATYKGESGTANMTLRII